MITKTGRMYIDSRWQHAESGKIRQIINPFNAQVIAEVAGFWTSDSARIHRVAKRLRFGTVWINDFNVYFTQAPWGGFKQSGLGRELGRHGLEEYREVKHIFHNHKPTPPIWFGRRHL